MGIGRSFQEALQKPSFLQHPTVVNEISSLGSGLIDPPNDGCSNAYGREEGVGASVVTSCDTPPVLETAEHAFDEVATLVGSLAVGGWVVASLAWGNAGLNAER